MSISVKTTAAILALGLAAGGCATPGPDDDMAERRTDTPWPARHNTEVITGERMSGADIGRALVGRELVARNLDTDTVNVVWLTPDKRVKWIKGDRISFGAWRIAGNRLCFRYDDPSREETCTEVYRQGPQRFVSVRDGKAVTRIELGKK